MIRLALILSFGLILPQVGAAEPLFVQSGEHDGFTRLVIARPAGADWAVTRTQETVTLTFPGEKVDFDTARIFDFVPRSRIRETTVRDQSLTLSLACDCAVSAFLEQSAFVVIDVASPGTTLQTPLLDWESAAADTKPRKPALRAAATALTAPFSAMPLPRRPLSHGEQVVLADMANRLQAELSLASDRGLLTPARDPQSAHTQPEGHTRAENAPSTIDGIPRDSRANMRISTSRDFHPADGDGRSGRGFGIDACPPEVTFNLATWGDNRPFSTQIAAARQGLFGEFDRLDPEHAKQLAQTYLYFGFGAEARQVLELDAALASDSAALLAMADLVDGLAPAQAEVLTRLTECETDVALWAILALPHPFEGAMPEPDAALRALNRLPAHLRNLLAPALSRKLLSNGHPDGAAAALRSLERLPAEIPTAAKLAQAHVDLKAGDNERGTQRLIEVVDKNAQQSPEALVALVDARIAADQPIDLGTANLVEAYAQELRDAPLGPSLRRAHVLALLKSGQFDRAFAASDTLGGDAHTRAATALRGQMLHELIHAAEDIVFLEHIFVQTDRDISLLREEDVIALASRLLNLGFPLRAENALAKLPKEPGSEERQLLAAEVSLALEKPYKAQADLLRISGEAADLLRAAANRMAGAHDEAHRIYSAMGRDQQAAETALLSGDWRDPSAQDNPVDDLFLADEAPEPGAVPESNEGMLARTSAILAESADARQTLATLLADSGSAPDAEN